MLLHQYLGWRGPVTHRQHATYLSWLDAQWDRPGSLVRLEGHVQQVATEVRRSYVKKPKKVKLQHLALKYGRTVEVKSGATGSKIVSRELKQQQTLLNAKTLKHQRKQILGGDKVVTLKITQEEAAHLRSLPPAEASALRRQWARERLGAQGV